MYRLFLILFFLSPLVAAAQPFEGTLTILVQGGEISTDESVAINYHVKGTDVRLDLNTEEGAISLIANRSVGRMSVLLAAANLYMEMALDNDDLTADTDTDASPKDDWTLTRTGNTRTIAGVDCVEYRYVDAEQVLKIWAPEPNRFGSLFTPQGPAGSLTPDWLDGTAFGDLFPFEIIDEEGTTVWAVTTVQEKTLPATLFAVPEGYGRFSMQMGY